jgi:RNA polymerase sigma factor (TIGR02999 family)
MNCVDAQIAIVMRRTCIPALASIAATERTDHTIDRRRPTPHGACLAWPDPLWHCPAQVIRGAAMEDVTQWLLQASKGDADAGARLYSAVYADLRRLAQRMLRGTSPDRVGATSLVHEAYLRLARPGALKANDRRHFFAVAARAMRQLVLDRARRRNTSKRGGEQELVSLENTFDEPAGSAPAFDVLAIDQALQQLALADPALAELVEMRFYAGLSMEEIGELSNLSSRTLKRDWRKARAFLHAQLGEGALPDEHDA